VCRCQNTQYTNYQLRTKLEIELDCFVHKLDDFMTVLPQVELENSSRRSSTKMTEMVKECRWSSPFSKWL
jgi:hypothetical protein